MPPSVNPVAAAAIGSPPHPHPPGGLPHPHPPGGLPHPHPPGGLPHPHPPGGLPHPHPPGGLPHPHPPGGLPHPHPPGGPPRGYASPPVNYDDIADMLADLAPNLVSDFNAAGPYGASRGSPGASRHQRSFFDVAIEAAASKINTDYVRATQHLMQLRVEQRPFLNIQSQDEQYHIFNSIFTKLYQKTVNDGAVDNSLNSLFVIYYMIQSFTDTQIISELFIRDFGSRFIETALFEKDITQHRYNFFENRYSTFICNNYEGFITTNESWKDSRVDELVQQTLRESPAPLNAAQIDLILKLYIIRYYRIVLFNKLCEDTQRVTELLMNNKSLILGNNTIQSNINRLSSNHDNGDPQNLYQEILNVNLDTIENSYVRYSYISYYKALINFSVSISLKETISIATITNYIDTETQDRLDDTILRFLKSNYHKFNNLYQILLSEKMFEIIQYPIVLGHNSLNSNCKLSENFIDDEIANTIYSKITNIFYQWALDEDNYNNRWLTTHIYNRDAVFAFYAHYDEEQPLYGSHEEHYGVRRSSVSYKPVSQGLQTDTDTKTKPEALRPDAECTPPKEPALALAKKPRPVLNGPPFPTTFPPRKLLPVALAASPKPAASSVTASPVAVAAVPQQPDFGIRPGIVKDMKKSLKEKGVKVQGGKKTRRKRK